MTIFQELQSWNPWYGHTTGPIPDLGTRAPSLPKLHFPRSDGRSVIVTFMRHCGCPFAEKTFLSLRKIAHEHPEIHCVAVSHSDESATDKWADAVGGPGKIEVIVDHPREMYAAYGLGACSFWHVLAPVSMMALGPLAKEENIRVRSTESGSRWQMAGTFSVSTKGTIEYMHIPNTAHETADFVEAVRALNRMAD